MGHEINLICPAGKGSSGDVIDMAMGVDEFHRLKVMFADESRKFFLFGSSVATGIHNGTFFGFIPEHKRVDLERIEAKALYVEHSEVVRFKKRQRYSKIESRKLKFGEKANEVLKSNKRLFYHH